MKVLTLLSYFVLFFKISSAGYVETGECIVSRINDFIVNSTATVILG